MTYVITVVYYLVRMLVENKPNQQKIDPLRSNYCVLAKIVKIHTNTFSLRDFFVVK